MNGYAVLKGASYTLAVTPDMVIHNGTTQTTEMIVNPESEYLKELPSHLRSFEDAVNYMPNQVYIGNEKPQKMAEVGFPWYDKLMDGASKDGKYGEIMPEDEFYGLIQICDVFDLVKLEKGFAADIKAKLDAHHMFTDEHVAILDKNSETTQEEIAALVNDEHAEPLYFNNALVGAVKRAHDVDVNLSAHVMLENLVTKASNVLSLLNLVKKAGVNPADIDYVVDWIRTDIVGRHTVGTGSAPQNVISSLVTNPLDEAGLKIVDIDKYSPEMQNPDITKPAGAGDVLSLIHI